MSFKLNFAKFGPKILPRQNVIAPHSLLNIYAKIIGLEKNPSYDVMPLAHGSSINDVRRTVGMCPTLLLLSPLVSHDNSPQVYCVQGCECKKLHEQEKSCGEGLS